jgi:hypothetical protein
MVRARVFGVVEASGLILMGERGFRAERARIVAVVCRNRRVASACDEAGIAVYRRRRELLRDYPPEDLTSLIGTPERGATRSPLTPQPPTGFDGVVFLAVWGRAALITAVLVALPMAPALVTAVLAQFAVLGLIAARLRH